MTAQDARLPALGWRDLWRLVNSRRPFDHHPLRVGFTILLVAYGAIAILRHHPDHPEFLYLRGAVLLHALAGIYFAPRVTWTALRAFTLGLALLLPLTSAYIDGTLGNDLSQLPLTALATFVPLVFVQTAWDAIAAGVLLVVGNALVLAVVPPPAVSYTTVLIVVLGAVVAGLAANLVSLLYRARLQHSLIGMREALRIKNEFLNTMSHELRSPIHVVLGYAEIVEETGVSPAAGQALTRIRASALELLQLVENTMNAARLEAGKVPLHVEEFAPEELTRDLAESIRALPEAGRGVAVHWDVAPDLPPVRLDRLKVKEIVQNLVSNALKFTSRGEVRVRVAREGERLSIAVRDTGIGIPAEAQARIFGMFERVETGQAEGPAGVGLGLYIVNRLIALMRGQARLESAPGAGSCFTVQLPLRLE